MGSPTPGVSLSQPGVPHSQRHGNQGSGRLDADHRTANPQAMPADLGRVAGVKSTESLEPVRFSLEDEIDDFDEDDRKGGHFKMAVSDLGLWACIADRTIISLYICICVYTYLRIHVPYYFIRIRKKTTYLKGCFSAHLWWAKVKKRVCFDDML